MIYQWIFFAHIYYVHIDKFVKKNVDSSIRCQYVFCDSVAYVIYAYKQHKLYVNVFSSSSLTKHCNSILE